MKAQIYRNLNKPGVQYSVRVNGKVVDYVTSAVLKDVTFKHPTAGAIQRIRSGPREVCAWVTGTLIDAGAVTSTRPWIRLHCDPKRFDYFTDVIGRRVDKSDWLLLSQTGEAFFK